MHRLPVILNHPSYKLLSDKSEHQLYFRISANLAPVMEHSLQTAWIQLQGRECCFNTVTRNILQTFGDFVYF